MGFSEEQVIQLLAEVFHSDDPRILVGIGDDAALVQGRSRQILTTDIAVEGVHFRRERSSGYEIGKRIAAANIADVLSMNGKTDYLLVAATLTGDESIEWIGELARGIADQARAAGALVVGGDLSRSATLSIAITAVGSTEKVVTRVGASVGESIYISSLTGWSAAGLAILSSGKALDLPSARYALQEFRAPTLDLGLDFSKASSMADVSDALMVQGGQMAKESSVKFEIDGELFAQSDEFQELRELADEVGVDPWSWILQGGEDHVLLATGHDLPGLRVGIVAAGSGITATFAGGEIKMAPVAWSHFDKGN